MPFIAAMGPAAGLFAGTVASSALQSRAAGKAADAASAASKNEVALNRYIFDKNEGNFSGWLEDGAAGRDALMFMMGLGDRPMIGGAAPAVTEFRETTSAKDAIDRFQVAGRTFDTRDEAEAYANADRTGARPYAGYEASPMAKYLLETGVDSIEGSRAAQGGLYSGATLEAMEANRRRVIGADVSEYMDRLTGISASGQNAAGQLGAAGANYAAGAGSAMRAGAYGQAQGYLGQADAWRGGIEDAAGIWGYFQNPQQAATTPLIRPRANPWY